MKFQIALLGVLFCLGAPAQTQTTTPGTKVTQSANRMKRQSASTAQQSFTGCVDQQDGRYVMRDAQSSELVTLQSPGSDDDTWFARHLGHQAQISGTKSAGAIRVTHIQQVADMCGAGK